MKTIITVIFFGILTYAVAQRPATLSQCQSDLPAKQDLSIETFFKDSWFVTHIKDGGNEATCREYQTKIENDTIKLNAVGEHKLNRDQNKHSTTNCSSSRGKTLKPEGPFVLQCRHTYYGDNERTTFFGMSFSVIETDYTDYALVYRCTKYTNMNYITRNLLLLHRSKTDDGSKAATSLQKHSLSLDQFQKTEGC
uniref:Salivary lipocalin n=1 Tax=Triatoma dimidiata TaxID=72491 RepID=A0A0V0G2H3_TRIDM